MSLDYMSNGKYLFRDRKSTDHCDPNVIVAGFSVLKG